MHENHVSTVKREDQFVLSILKDSFRLLIVEPYGAFFELFLLKCSFCGHVHPDYPDLIGLFVLSMALICAETINRLEFVTLDGIIIHPEADDEAIFA